MRSLGVDLAAQPEKTALCVVDWSTTGTARVTRLAAGATDQDILSAIDVVTRIAVDVPFGWPTRFVETVVAHSEKAESPLDTPDPIDLRWRETDQFVFDRTGLRPLSVSTDRIGASALRWARLEQLLRGDGVEVDRRGLGRFVEVYPAAALVTWGLPHSMYKGAKRRTSLASLLRALEEQISYMDLGEHRSQLAHSDDAFDALVCSLVARAAYLGLTEKPTLSSLASTEGWIHLPESGSLASLARLSADDRDSL